MHDVRELQALFGSYLRQQRFRNKPRNLYQPFSYMLGLPAKRLRPTMLLMACEMFGTSATKALPQAFAVELFHNFTLIHDDIMDEAPLRRGRPSVHKKFGASTAILSGDAMLVYAYEYLVKADAKVVSELLRVFNLCATRVCEGQQLDMNYEMSNKVTTKDYLIMIELKTAALLAASLQLGAIVGGASPKDSQHLYEFGGQLGVSFQLRDDLLDAFGESEKIGKQRGGDIVQNKKTFLFLEAMRIADTKTKTQLTSLYSSKAKSGREKVAAVISIFRKLGIEGITAELIDMYHSKAIKNLNKVNAKSKKKEALMQMAARLLRRES